MIINALINFQPQKRNSRIAVGLSALPHLQLAFKLFIDGQKWLPSGLPKLQRPCPTENRGVALVVLHYCYNVTLHDLKFCSTYDA